jgi:hypothetical protein
VSTILYQHRDVSSHYKTTCFSSPARFFYCRNSDMWAKDYGPSIIRRYLFLTAHEGCRPAVVASVAELPRDIFYLQPYKMPWKGASLPLFQALGPYQGHNTFAQPRLPPDGGARASAALWDVSEQFTGSIWPHNNSL